MNKKVLFAAFAAACLALAGCEEEKEKIEVTPATLLSFSFTMEKNPEILANDVTVSNPQSSIIKVELPVGTSNEAMKAMVPSFETSEEEAIVYIDGAEVVSGTSVCDFSNDVDLYVTYGGVTTNYVISVYAKDELKWNLVAENADSTFNSTPQMAINPVDGKVYVLSSLPSEGEQPQYPLGYVLDNGLKPIAGTSAVLNETSIADYSIGVSDEGGIFICFKENQKYSVASVTNGFSYVGESGALPRNYNQGVVIPVSSDDVWVAYPLFAATNGLAKRTLELAHWTVGWETEMTISPERPASAYAYTCKAVYANNQRYLFIYNQNQNDVSLYRLDGRSWETVFESMKIKDPDGNDYEKLAIATVCLDVASNGEFYMLVAPQYDGTNYRAAVIKYNEETGRQTIIGGILTDLAPSASSVWSMALDNFDTPYLIYPKDDNLCITYIDNKTKTWSAPSIVSATVVKAGIAFAENGDAYICGRNKENGHVVIYSSTK